MGQKMDKPRRNKDRPCKTKKVPWAAGPYHKLPTYLITWSSILVEGRETFKKLINPYESVGYDVDTCLLDYDIAKKLDLGINIVWCILSDMDDT